MSDAEITLHNDACLSLHIDARFTPVNHRLPCILGSKLPTDDGCLGGGEDDITVGNSKSLTRIEAHDIYNINNKSDDPVHIQKERRGIFKYCLITEKMDVRYRDELPMKDYSNDKWDGFALALKNKYMTLTAHQLAGRFIKNIAAAFAPDEDWDNDNLTNVVDIDPFTHNERWALLVCGNADERGSDGMYNYDTDTTLAGTSPGGWYAISSWNEIDDWVNMSYIDKVDDKNGWDSSADTIFWDKNNDNIFDAGDEVLAGVTPAFGTKHTENGTIDDDWDYVKTYDKYDDGGDWDENNDAIIWDEDGKGSDDRLDFKSDVRDMYELLYNNGWTDHSHIMAIAKTTGDPGRDNRNKIDVDWTTDSSGDRNKKNDPDEDWVDTSYGTDDDGITKALKDLDKGIGDNAIIFIYFRDHGGKGTFETETGDGDYYYSSLDHRINKFYDDGPNCYTTVVVSACKSGSVITECKGKNRLILSSQDSTHTSYGSRYYFHDYLSGASYIDADYSSGPFDWEHETADKYKECNNNGHISIEEAHYMSWKYCMDDCHGDDWIEHDLIDHGPYDEMTPWMNDQIPGEIYLW